MKRAATAGLVAAALALAHLGVTAAETAKFRYVASLYAAADKDIGFNGPEAVACGANGQVVVGDTGNDRLLRFTYRDKVLGGISVLKLAELSAPSRVQLTSKGEIYVLDGKQRRIVHLGGKGEFKGTVAFEGAPAPTTTVVKGFAIDAADRLYALDVFSGRVLVLDAQGRFERAIPLPGDVGFASDLAVDAAGNLLVLDSIKRRILLAGKEGAAFTPLGGDLISSLPMLPTYITTSKDGIFVVESSGSSIVSYGRDGSVLARQLATGWEEGTLNHPSQMCFNDKDEVFIADRDNSRIQIFQIVR
jgi:sugar lactone lactonase YvrE